MGLMREAGHGTGAVHAGHLLEAVSAFISVWLTVILSGFSRNRVALTAAEAHFFFKPPLATC